MKWITPELVLMAFAELLAGFLMVSVALSSNADAVCFWSASVLGVAMLLCALGYAGQRADAVKVTRERKGKINGHDLLS
jgi:lipid-A-disaccharide synthase-like uncharacterized protein